MRFAWLVAVVVLTCGCGGKSPAGNANADAAPAPDAVVSVGETANLGFATIRIDEVQKAVSTIGEEQLFIRGTITNTSKNYVVDIPRDPSAVDEFGNSYVVFDNSMCVDLDPRGNGSSLDNMFGTLDFRPGKGGQFVFASEIPVSAAEKLSIDMTVSCPAGEKRLRCKAELRH